MELHEVQLVREHGFDPSTLLHTFFNKFFEAIGSKVDFNDFKEDVDHGIYFAVGTNPSDLMVECSFFTRLTIPDNWYTMTFVAFSENLTLSDFPLVILVANNPKFINDSNRDQILDLSQAYQFRVNYYDVPIYVLCEDERSLVKNEFLKTHH